MWDELRRRLFPATCVGCEATGTLLCPACAPAPAARMAVELHGVPIRACAAYDGPFRRAILALKDGDRAGLDALPPMLAMLLDQRDAAATLVPVTTTWWRANRRGFDQSIALARRVGAAASLPVADVLRRRGLAQHGAGRLRRLSSLGRYRVVAGAVLPRTALLVDDVCTTGATLRDAAATLRAAGVTVGGAVVLALAQNDAAGSAQRAAK